MIKKTNEKIIFSKIIKSKKQINIGLLLLLNMKPKKIVYYDFDKTLIENETILHGLEVSKKINKRLTKDKKEANTKVEILSCRGFPTGTKSWKAEAKRLFDVKINQIRFYSLHQCLSDKIEFLNKQKEQNPQAKIILYDDQKERILKIGGLKKGIKVIDPEEVK